MHNESMKMKAQICEHKGEDCFREQTSDGNTAGLRHSLERFVSLVRNTDHAAVLNY